MKLTSTFQSIFQHQKCVLYAETYDSYPNFKIQIKFAYRFIFQKSALYAGINGNFVTAENMNERWEREKKNHVFIILA